MNLLRLALPLTLMVALVAGPTATRGETPVATSIVGKWFGKDDKGIEGGFVFEADGSADMIKAGESLEASFNGQATITYRFDPATKPMELDLVIARKDGRMVTMRCIVDFLSPTKIKVRRPSGNNRPADFSGPENENIVLEKVVNDKK